jgi:protein SCO1/2
MFADTNRARRIAMALASTATVLSLLGCGASRNPPATKDAPPTPTSGTVVDEAIPAAVANVPLVDQAGRHFTLASLRGKTVVLADFLTLCQEICPLTSVNLRDVAKALPRAGAATDVQVVEATVDPERDTVARLAAYQKLFGANRNWTFATGNRTGLDRLWAFLGVNHERVGEGAGPAPRDWWTGVALTYDIQHQDVIYVIDPHGHLRWLDNGTPKTMGSAPPSTMLRFLSAQGKQNLASPTDPTWTVSDIEQALAYVTGRPFR